VTVYEPPDPRRIRPLAALRRLLDARDLFVTLSLHRISVRYRQSRLGILWAGIQPVAMMLVFTLMFTFLRVRPSPDVPFPLFAYSALIPWTMFSSGLNNASTALTSHAGLLTKVSFPREILPLTYVCAAAIDCAVASALLVLFMVFYGITPGPHALAAPLILAVLFGLICGIALIAAATQVRVRDVGVAMPIVLQLLMFASPVAYPMAAVPPRLLDLYMLNPLVGIVENVRRAALGTGPVHLESLGVSIVWVVMLLPLGYAWFKWVEATAADLV
jgi:lipopolysaccharide transport system permease protein